MGNIYAESGFNAGAIEGGSGIGFGLCQWSYGRRTQLEAYAASKGLEPSDVDTQIEFLLGELTPGGGANGYATYNLMNNHGYTPNDWKNASTPESAAEIFCWIFERPGIPRMSVRTEAARRYYEQFKDAERPSGGNESGTEIQNKVVEIARSMDSFGWGLHRCEGWAEDVYRHAGLTIPGMPCATEAGWAWQVSTSRTGIPLGAMVFGDAYGVNHGEHNAGHVGVYVGNNEVVSNANGEITLESLDSWISRFNWKGWGWAGGIDLTKY